MALPGPVLGNGCNLRDRAWGGIKSPPFALVLMEPD